MEGLELDTSLLNMLAIVGEQGARGGVRERAYAHSFRKSTLTQVVLRLDNVFPLPPLPLLRKKVGPVEVEPLGKRSGHVFPTSFLALLTGVEAAAEGSALWR